MKNSEVLDATLDELAVHGAEDIEVDDAGRTHPRVYFTWEGKRSFVTIALSASDWRAPRRARQVVRQQLGVSRKITKSPRRGETRDCCRQDKPAEPESITPGRDPWAPLRDLKKQARGL